MKKVSLVINYSLFFVLLFGMACGQEEKSTSPIPENCKQIILLTAETIDTSFAMFQRYEKNEQNEWTKIGEAVHTCFGRKGLARGIGLHPENSLNGPVKKEGDGKSPSGIFTLGKIMGFKNPEECGIINMPYEKIINGLECIDDRNSPYYNQIIKNDTVSVPGWSSSERMWRYGGWYDWIIVVNHNKKDRIKGSGSCIFMHLRAARDEDTAGCTTLDLADMEDLVFWLDAEKNPLLIQLTKTQYDEYQSKWTLP